MKPKLAITAVGIAAAAVVSACSSGGAAAPAASNSGTLVVDDAFAIESLDPGRGIDITDETINKITYDTLLTFNGANNTTLVPDLASKYAFSDGGRTLTLTLASGRVFSDGTPVTAADVVFSLDRVIGLNSNAEFLLAGDKVTSSGPHTVTITSATPNYQLPAILTSPSLGILNEKVVKAHGGSTTTSDKAGAYLNSHSAGSGPYILSSIDPTSQAILVKNPKYNGSQHQYYQKIILRNTSASTQVLDVGRGAAQVALNLTSAQVSELSSGVKVVSQPAALPIYLGLSQNPVISKVTSNAKFLEGVKQGINSKALLPILGKSSLVSPGIIPQGLSGALTPGKSYGGLAYDPNAAKRDFAESGVAKDPLTLTYGDTAAPGSVNIDALAQAIKAQLNALGVTNLTLAPEPNSTDEAQYHTAKLAFTLGFWVPDYIDGADYVSVFAPGGVVGLREGWPASADPSLAREASAALAAEPAQREADFRQFQVSLNQAGPYVPIALPGVFLVGVSSIQGIAYNADWTINLAELH